MPFDTAENGRSRVLIVDRSDDSREILKTALQQRGLATLDTGRVEDGVHLAGCHHPEVIVLDAEEVGEESAICAGFDAREDDDDRPAILLVGTIRPHAFSGDRRQFVEKPYHYGPLIRRIEELLQVQ